MDQHGPPLLGFGYRDLSLHVEVLLCWHMVSAHTTHKHASLGPIAGQRTITCRHNVAASFKTAVALWDQSLVIEGFQHNRIEIGVAVCDAHRLQLGEVPSLKKSNDDNVVRRWRRLTVLSRCGVLLLAGHWKRLQAGEFPGFGLEGG